MASDEPPVFTAKISPARLLFTHLRCIGFEDKAQVQISSEGVAFTVEDSRVTQGRIFIDKQHFAEYHFDPPGYAPGDAAVPTPQDDDDSLTFGISLSTLLECLQIFGIDTSQKWHGSAANSAAQSKPPQSDAESCELLYTGEGHPLRLTLRDAFVETKCSLVTYEPEPLSNIEFAMGSVLALRIIMKADWLHDAVQELEGPHVERVVLAASPDPLHFSLSATGSLGSTAVEFEQGGDLFEKFDVPEPIRNTYKFALIKNAAKAMAIATKVSIRSDSVGMLVMQFMVEHEGHEPIFVDYRFLPYAANDSGGSDEE